MTSTDALPPGWEIVELGKVVDVRLGRQRSPKNHTGDNMRPYLRAANVTWRGLDLSDVKQMNFSPEEVGTFGLLAGDILLSEASGSADEVGKPALWSGEITDCCFQNTLIRLRGKGLTDPQFLYFRMLFEALMGSWTEEIARGVGIHHIGSRRLEKWTFALPPLEAQVLIAEEIDRRLTRVGVVERSLRSTAKKIELCRDAVIHALAFSQFPRIALEDVLSESLANGRSVRTLDGGFPVLRLTALRPGGHIDVTAHKQGEWTRDQAAQYLVKDGDFLVARGNGSLRLVGRGGLVRAPAIEVAYPDTLIRVRVDPERYDPEFLRLVWDGRAIREQIEGAARTTAGIYKVNQAGLRNVSIPFPDLATQRDVVREADRRLTLLAVAEDAVGRSLRRCSEVRRAILHVAFTGRLATECDRTPSASALETSNGPTSEGMG